MAQLIKQENFSSNLSQYRLSSSFLTRVNLPEIKARELLKFT